MRALCVVFLFVASSASAQWLNYPDPHTPRTKAGTPDLTAPAPRISGHPDLSGVWQADRTPDKEYASLYGDEFLQLQIDTQDFTKNTINVFWGLKPEEEPLRPDGAAAFKEHAANPANFPLTRCLPSGVPVDLTSLAFKVIQTPGEIVMLMEIGSPPRQIHTDGRALPADPDPLWMGYSVAKWDGDTLVVETNGLNDRGWLDAFGHPRSEQTHITERYHRRDFGHMDVEFKFDDPKYYTRPFGFKTALTLLPDSDLLEYVCAENEKDRARL